MGRRGPKPQPTRLKILKGNPGKRRLNEQEPDLPAEVPPPPDWLDGPALVKYRTLAQSLYDAKILTTLDGDVLALYCRTWVRWVTAEQALEKGLLSKTPNGHIQPSPFVSIARAAVDQLRTLEAELGMTPSSRSRVQAVDRPTTSKSKWAGILSA